MYIPTALLISLFSPLWVYAAAFPASQFPLETFSRSSFPNHGFKIPTVHQSTVLARRMLHLEGLGTLSTIFPSASETSSEELRTFENRPSSVAHQPFGLPEYIADCEPGTGNPTILEVDIANTFKNARAGSNVTLSVRWHPPGRPEGEYSAAMMPRFALVGWLEEMSFDDEDGMEEEIKKCWLRTHPDTVWTPGNDIHISRWVRFRTEEIFWFGGFGDRARIQWLDPKEFRNITREEINQSRLPGEGRGDDVGFISFEEL